MATIGKHLLDLAIPLMLRCNNDGKLGVAIDVINLNQLNQTNGLLIAVYGNKTPFGVIMDMLVIQVFQLVHDFNMIDTSRRLGGTK